MPVENPQEKELADLRAERDRLAKETADAKAAAEAAAKQAAEHKSQLDQVVNYVRENMTQPQSSATPPAEPEDEDAIVSRRDLKKTSEAIRQEAQKVTADALLATLRNQRAINRQIAEQRYPEFEKHAAEIDAALDRLAPDVAAAPTAYKEVYDFIVKRNRKDIRELSDDEFEAERRRRFGDPESENESGSEALGAESAPHGAESARPQPAILPSSAGRSAASGSKKPQPKLSPDEEYMRTRFGMSAEEWIANKGETQPSGDFMDMKGRPRV
jgi:hypothetical protein